MPKKVMDHCQLVVCLGQWLLQYAQSQAQQEASFHVWLCRNGCPSFCPETSIILYDREVPKWHHQLLNIHVAPLSNKIVALQVEISAQAKDEDRGRRPCLGFRIERLGFGGLGFRVWGLGFRVWGFRV